MTNKIKMTSLFMTLMGATIFQSLQAQVILLPIEENGADINVSKIAFAGNGCLPTASRLSQLNRKMVVLTHNGFEGSLANGSLIRKACTVRIPVTVQPGYQVALQAFTMGKAELAANETLTTTRELFVAGLSSEIQNTVFEGELEDRILVAPQAESELQFTPCGKSSVLAMNLSARLKANSGSFREGNFSLNKTRLSIVTRKCE